MNRMRNFMTKTMDPKPPGELNREFLSAVEMMAVGMTEMPEVGEVSSRLSLLRVKTPRPRKGQVAIALRASAMHIDEIYAAQGTCLGRFFGPKKISTDNPYVLGSSVSGTVVALGNDATKFKIGEEVVVIPNETGEFGSWADYRCVDQKMVMLKPEALSHVEAAAATMASCVAWGAIDLAKVKSGSRCVVVGASGSIGIMILQFLKSLDCHVTAVCSGASASFVRDRGADAVVDYTTHDFGPHLRDSGRLQDVVFDCVGGRDVEASAFLALRPTGLFATVVGPQQYIGEEKLSWWKFGKVMAYIGYRMVSTLLRGPRYIFGEKYPRLVIESAMQELVGHGIRMPIQDVIPFELASVVSAVDLLTTHRAKGRIVIDFSMANGGETGVPQTKC